MNWACNYQTISVISIMQPLLKTLLFCSAFTCFAGYSSSLLSQTGVGEYEDRVPPAIMPPMATPDYSTKREAGGSERANQQEALLDWQTYGRNGNHALGSQVRSVRPMSGRISKNAVRTLVRALKKSTSIQGSSQFALHLPPEHLVDADFISELKALLPNCVFVPDLFDPSREFLNKYPYPKIPYLKFR